ncbi:MULTISPECIES: CoA transferase subunit A [Prauserella]|nr:MULTISPECIES: CoA transferase subunit A [Prauserella]
MTLDSALAGIGADTLIAVGGLWYHNRPAAAIRALLRGGVSGLRLLTSPPSSFDTDLLIGAGAVRTLYTAHVSFEHLGLAPRFRRAAERAELEIIECDEATVLGGLMATLEGLPDHPVPSLVATDLLRTSTQVRTGTDGPRAPALRPDVAVLHAQEADRFGNVRHLGAAFCDPVFAKASARVVVTVDRLVGNDVVRAEPWRTTIPGYLVDAVVPLPYGAHPCSSHGLYCHDEEHLRHYLAAAGAPDGDGGDAFARYLREFVHLDHATYLDRIGGTARLDALDEEVA